MADQVLAKLAIQIAANTAQFNSQLKLAQNQFASFTNGLTSTAKNVGVALGGIFAGRAIFNGLRNAQQVASSFEATMSEVKAITGAVGKEFQKLENDAKRLGGSTKFTATEVGELQVAYGRLGFTTKEILQATEATLDLAAATGEDLAKSADVAGSTVRGFGLQAVETQRVVDVMAASFNKTALGLENFTESMKYVAPVAAAAGATVEETTALLGTLADAGIRGSMAGTSLRKIFTDMTKDGRPLKERLAELAARGITLADSFDEVGRTAQTSLLILSKNTQKTDELAESFLHVTGEAKKMALVMSDNLIGDATKLTSAFEGLFIKLSQSEELRELAQILTAVVNALAGTRSIDTNLEALTKWIQVGGDAERLKPFIDSIKEIRRETGKKIEDPQLDFLIDKYQLTYRQGQDLRDIIKDINDAISFQETVVKNLNFINVERGYNDITKAASAYIDELNALIVAETNRNQQLKQNAIDLPTNSGILKTQLDESQTLIDRYLRIIEAVREYIGTLKAGTGGTDFIKEQVETLATLEAGVQKLIAELKGIPTFDIPGLQAKTKEIEELALKIERIKDAIEGIRPELFGANSILSNNALNVSGKQSLTGGTSDKQIVGSTKNKGVAETIFSAGIEIDVDGYIAQLEQIQEKTVKFVSSMEEEFVNFSGVVHSALSGLGQALGTAISGSQDLGKALLGVLGNVLVQLGEMILAAGIGVEAFKASLESLQGPVAIAAGLALIALGTAISASISNLGSSAGSSGSSSIPTSPSRVSYGLDGAKPERVNFTFRIEGTDLVAVIDKTNKENGRLIGTG